ncbi:hypothetical protein BaRGS_00021501 [Batillaria attramentaria]|uniref:tetrahydrofolate synthase n=1 Tax=Batillaria attramentaria TaxID=370345 RepID=A0ABD0KJI1_9CAEN
MPSMFGLVFLVAVYIFVRVEKVDVAVIEVGLGGQFDPNQHHTAASGTDKTRLPGRAQIMKKGNVTYTWTVAHTTDSMEQCAKWFQDEAKKECSTIRGNVVRALVFCMTKPRLAAPHLQYLKDCGFRVAAFCPCVISTSAREHFIDHISLSYDRAEANQRAAEQMKDWETVVSALPAGQPNVCNGYVSADPPCLSASFPSTVSALWWASLGKNASLEALARADLGIDGGGVGTGGVEVPDVDAVHVQVLVTGSMLMVGRAIKLLDARE